MKILKYALAALAALMLITSCSDTETYADKKKKERSAINRYIKNNNISVISEEKFFSQDSMTDVSKNEYVLFESSGVYMQIIRKGCGEKLKIGETATALCRFNEYNLLESDSTLQLTNIYQYPWLVDKLNVSNNSGTINGSFISGSSLMYTRYGQAAVPSGWLTPLSYVNLGRPKKEGDQKAKVKIIVPHSEGQSDASSNVYPCLYELIYERGI